MKIVSNLFGHMKKKMKNPQSEGIIYRKKSKYKLSSTSINNEMDKRILNYIKKWREKDVAYYPFLSMRDGKDMVSESITESINKLIT